MTYESKHSANIISVNRASACHSAWASDFFYVINNPPWHFQHDLPNIMHFLIRQITRLPQTQDDVYFILVLSSKPSMCFVLLVSVLTYWTIYQAMRLNKLYIMWFNATDNVVRWAGTTKYGLLNHQTTHRNMLVVHQPHALCKRFAKYRIRNGKSAGSLIQSY